MKQENKNSQKTEGVNVPKKFAGHTLTEEEKKMLRDTTPSTHRNSSCKENKKKKGQSI